MQKTEKKLNEYAKERKVVKVEYFDEEWSGVVLKNSKDFLLLHEIKDFAYGGFVVFNKKFITEIVREKQEKFDEKVVKHCTKRPKQIVSWLDIKSFESIFTSLKENFNYFCVDSTEDIDTFFVGQGVDFDAKYLTLNAIDTYARFYDESIDIKIKDIGYILFGDTYSTSLFRYAKEAK